MSERTITTKDAARSPAVTGTVGLLQRRCDCGNSTTAGEQCEECGNKNLRRKLRIGATNDPLELEADRVADQIMAMPANSAAGTTAPHIQRVESQGSGYQAAAPVSVNRALAESGRPLEPHLEREMEQRFGRDFSRVRIHSSGIAEQSASDVNARAYTVGHNIVFGTGQYVPGSGEGQKLLAHELSHVVQQSSSNTLRRTPADAKSKQAQQSTTADDYIKAETYLTDYYDNEDKIVTDIYLNANVAVHAFGIYSSSKEKEGSEPPMATIKAVLGLIPDAEPILEVLEMLEKRLAIAKEVAGIVSKPEKKADVGEVTAEALTNAVSPYTKQRESLSKQRRSDREYLENLRADPKTRGVLLQTIRARLGPMRSYNADVIAKFAREYELQLYKEYFVQNAWINHMPPSLFGNPFTRYVIQGVPEAAQKRILSLFTQLGHAANVSIDTRFASANPEYAEVVKILLDWDVKLYWLRGYVSDKPEALHTGGDLQQPYKGERFKEVN